MSATPRPERAPAARRQGLHAVLGPRRREPQRDRLRLRSYLVAPGERMRRRTPRTDARTEAEPAT